MRPAAFALLAAAGCSVEGDLGGGAITPACASVCDGACVDLDADRNHCGNCSTACGADEVCRSGACAYPWPTRWTAAYRETFVSPQPAGWSVYGGACAAQGPAMAPDGTTAWDLRPDWAHLRRTDPLPADGDRAWVFRIWVEPPTDRAWEVRGCVRTLLNAAYGPMNGAGCFRFSSTSGAGVAWYADDRYVTTTPVAATGRWFEFRWEIAATHRRARAWLDGAIAWEGAIDDGAWSERDWWTVNVSRDGGFAGCNQGRFFLAEAREEVGGGP